MVFAHRSGKLVGCILTDVGDLILYTLKLGPFALSRIGIPLAPAKGSLGSAPFGFELLELLYGELEYCAVTGYSWVLESYVDTDDGLWCFELYCWTVEGDCHVPMRCDEAHRVACDFALETWLLSDLYVADVWKMKAVVYDTAGIVTKLERDSLRPLVLLRVLCFAP